MRRIFLVLICILTFNLLSYSQYPVHLAKVAKSEARKFKKEKWKSMTDESIDRQLCRRWMYEMQVDSLGNNRFLSKSAIFQGYTIEAALDSALLFTRTLAIDELIPCHISADDQFENEYNILRDNNRILCIKYNVEGDIVLDNELMNSPSYILSLDTKRFGYDSYLKEIQKCEIITLCVWRLRDVMFEVHICALYSIEDLLGMLQLDNL